MYKKRKKTRRYANGGIPSNVSAYFMENKDAINERYADLKEMQDKVDHAKAYYTEKYGITGYPSDLTAQEVYLGDKEGPITLKQEATHDTLSRRQRSAISGEDYDYAPYKDIHTGEIVPTSGYQGSDFDPRLSNRALEARLNRTRFLREAQGKNTAGATEALRELKAIEGGEKDFFGNVMKKEHGGMVDDSNQPDSITNYIKGNDKYRMGGVPNDDNFSDMGDNMKHGGMVNKSKGNRDPFTNQYD